MASNSVSADGTHAAKLPKSLKSSAAVSKPSKSGKPSKSSLPARASSMASRPTEARPRMPRGQASAVKVTAPATPRSQEAPSSSTRAKVRALGDASAAVVPAKRRKTCSFLCGAVCFQTPDPVDSSRPSIRWAYDLADVTSSTGEGANDWYCERTWVTVVTHREPDHNLSLIHI